MNSEQAIKKLIENNYALTIQHKEDVAHEGYPTKWIEIIVATALANLEK